MRYILPKKVIKEQSVSNSEVLLKSTLNQATLSSNEVCTIKKGGYIILDFGKEIHGGLDITVQMTGDDSGKMHVTFGESVSESMSTIGFKNATNNHAIRDMIVDVPFMSNFNIGKTGFRFVKIEVLNSEIQFRTILADFMVKDIEYKGSFKCSDELINDIWNTGAYTVYLNMHDYLWDGIKRDRLVWVGDMHPEVSIISAVFGYDDCVPKSLDLIKSETLPSDWINGIPAYSMWWIKIQRDWYYQNGDFEYLKEQEEYLLATLEHIIKNINDDGTNNIDYKFVDWCSNETPAAEAGLHAMFKIALIAGAEICEILGNNNFANVCKSKLKALDNYSPDNFNNKQIAGLEIFADSRALEKNMKNVLKPKPLEGLSTFLGFYVLKAYGEAKDISGALEILRGYWGGMLEMGATTFWEDFDINWMENAYKIDELPKDGMNDVHGDNGRFCYEGFRHSLCHGWAGGPTAFLSQYVLGVHVLAPGCKKIMITPNIGDLKWAEGSYPTPYGNINISHKLVDGKLKTTVDAPSEIEIVRGK
ncbi:MAG: alpha-L-rhamnosidase C-terminal domain-containing protein [Oscillospiraceae bacterium]